MAPGRCSRRSHRSSMSSLRQTIRRSERPKPGPLALGPAVTHPPNRQRPERCSSSWRVSRSPSPQCSSSVRGIGGWDPRRPRDPPAEDADRRLPSRLLVRPSEAQAQELNLGYEALDCIDSESSTASATSPGSNGFVITASAPSARQRSRSRERDCGQDQDWHFVEVGGMAHGVEHVVAVRQASSGRGRSRPGARPSRSRSAPAIRSHERFMALRIEGKTKDRSEIDSSSTTRTRDIRPPSVSSFYRRSGTGT